MSFYRGKYIIAAYDAETEDELIGIYDNPKEMEEQTGLNYIECRISRIYYGRTRTIDINGIKCSIFFIDMTEEGEE